jgi:ABC-type transporter Mla subunit MlaD
LLLLALAAGCGGDDGGDSVAEWADDVCSAGTNWTESVTATAQSLSGGGLDQEEVRGAVGDLEDATRDFAQDLRALGPPDTGTGDEAEAALDDLAGDIEESVAEMKTAVDGVSSASEALAAVTAVSAILTTMGEQLAATLARLDTLDPQGELEAAFEEADACQELTADGS